MGGLGSGRKYRKSEIKPVLEDRPDININDFNRENLLVSGNIFTNFYMKDSQHPDIFVEVGENFLLLKYWYKLYPQEQQILIKKIPANYGGTRPFLVCPLCSAKRVSLYLGATGEFACRICHKLAYKSQKMNPHQRHMYMAEKYKDKLGQSSYPYDKPFRMWNQTFLNLQDKAFTHEKKSCDLFIEYADNLLKKYGER